MSARRLERLPVRSLPGGLSLFEASKPLARILGLAGVGELEPGHALLLPCCRCVHTFGMRFAIDVVFLDRVGRVARVACAVGPRRAVGCRRARSVVETRAGQGERFARALAERGM